MDGIDANRIRPNSYFKAYMYMSLNCSEKGDRVLSYLHVQT